MESGRLSQAYIDACQALEAHDESRALVILGQNPHLQWFPGDGGRTLRDEFISRGDVRAVEILLNAGISPNGKNNEGFTPPQCAIDSECPNLEVMRLLLDQGADPHEVGTQLDDSLHFAVCRNRCEALRLMLERGANPDKPSMDYGSYTPLMYAAFCGRAEAARILLAHGADAGLLDDTNRTPATIARQQGHIDVADLIEQWQMRNSPNTE